MWKEQLPNNCPPGTALERNVHVFRIIKNMNIDNNDFVPYARKYPDNQRYKNLCKAYALSFYDSYLNALKSIKESYVKGLELGSYIACFQLEEKDGKAELNVQTGHLSVWFYKYWNVDNFKLIKIEKANEN